MPLVAAYPTALDALANPTATTNRDDAGFELDEVIARIQDILEALEAKVGIGASVPSSAGVLRRTAPGVTAWGQIAAGDYAAGSIAAGDLAASTTLVKIAEVSGTGSSGTISFSSVPGTYRSLSLEYVGRSSAALTTANVSLTFESSPTALYYHQQLVAQATGVTASENLGTTNAIMAGFVSGASSAANLHGGARISLPEYASATNWKAVSVQQHGGCAGTTALVPLAVVTGFFASASPISLIRLTLSSGNWTTSSLATLYGLPG